MKKLKTLILCFALLLPSSASSLYAGGAVSAAMLSVIEGTQLEHLAATIANGIQIVEQVYIAWTHLQYGIQTAQTALQNLKDFDYSKLKTLDDWMNFANRQMDIERRTEAIFSNIRINVGGKPYGLIDALDIPQAIAENEYNQWNSEFTDKERRQIWNYYGLKTANYYYMKTWQNREKQLVTTMAAAIESLLETQEETAGQVEEIISGSRDTDSANDLAQAQIEMQGIQIQQTMETNQILARQSSLMAAESQIDNHIQMPLAASDAFLVTDPAFDE